MPPYRPIPDPFVSKAPIPANGAGFYPRDEVFANILNLLRAGDSISIVGERKAGKTSFLNYLLTHLPTDEFIPVFIDTQSIAPQTDQIFLGSLLRKAAQAIAHYDAADLAQPPDIDTLTVEVNHVYVTFQDDLSQLRSQLPTSSTGQRKRLIWLIDEIEALRSYSDTILFSFLRPLAQTDPDFRFVVAGYDVLYTLSSLSEWSPFFNAFRNIGLERLTQIAAKQLVADALERMNISIAAHLFQIIFEWTGQKPFYLKWFMTTLAAALNHRQTDYQIDEQIIQTAQALFLNTTDLGLHFAHLWNTHTTPRQQTLLSLIASQSGPYKYPTILDELKEKQLIAGDRQATQHVIDDLTRLQQLGFLYEYVGEYTFTSTCLKSWIEETKPLG